MIKGEGFELTGDMLVEFLQEGILAMYIQREFLYGCRKTSKNGDWDLLREIGTFVVFLL